MNMLRIGLVIAAVFGTAQICAAKDYAGPWGDVQSSSNDPWGQTAIVPPSQPIRNVSKPVPTAVAPIQAETLVSEVPAPPASLNNISDNLQMLGLGGPAPTPTLVPSATIPPMDGSIREIQECVNAASLRNNVPVGVIYGIMKTEGGRVGTVSRNTNGSDDLGVMQINNETWIPVLQKQLGQEYQQVRSELIYNPCFNINVGTSILAQYHNQTDQNLDDGARWITAVGWYNSHDGYYMHRYQKLFLHNFLSMFGAQLEQVATR